MPNLEPIIGLEIHAQINTRTKMFCNCSNDNFGKEPNSSVCPVCMAFPGSLPMPNRTALNKALRAALSLGCQIPPQGKFDRKNYFYPDLPAGFQISQYDEPLALSGNLTYEVNGEQKTCRIHRLHIENDAGKLVHLGGNSFCDYNRAGTPLMEIVTEPDLRSAQEASAFAQELARLLQFASASDCNMFKGQMRFDASVSLREKGRADLTPRSEIKNLNSFRSLEQAIQYEIKRQTEAWKERGGPPTSECTVGWVDDLGETRFLRSKESAADYRYFPEPDLPPLSYTEEEIKKISSQITEPPLARRSRYQKELNLTLEDAHTLVDNPPLCLFYEEVAALSNQPRKAANWILTEILGRLKEGQTIQDLRFSAANLAELLRLVESGTISGKQAKEVLDIMWVEGGSPDTIVAEHNLEQFSDTQALESIIDNIIKTPAGQDALENYQKGRKQALGFIVGQVMKETKGSANPQIVNKLLQEKLS